LLPVPIYYDVKSLDDIRLYYNGPMFSALYKIIDMESRQFISQIYETLDPQVKAEKKLEEFVQNYDPLFGKIDFPVGKIVIKNIEIINRKRVLEYDHMYSRLVKIDVIKNSFVRSYYFNFDNGQWTYID